jgi:hypothetical protein
MDFTKLFNVLLFTQLVSALTGLFYFKKFKTLVWQSFSIYLIIIFLNELFNLEIFAHSSIFKKHFYLYYGIPFQFIFLFWLYSKSIKNKSLFFVFTSLYVLSLVLYVSFSKKTHTFNPTYLLGSLFLFILTILEFLRQVKSDTIIRFYSNKMFYINGGVFLFYVGTLPFYLFYKYFDDYTILIYSNFVYGLNCSMYLLFIASFIWGKETSK